MYCLQGILIDDFERTGAVRRTRIVTQIQEIVFRQFVADTIKDSKPSITTIKNTNHGAKVVFFYEICK